jgi:hypothetical protein
MWCSLVPVAQGASGQSEVAIEDRKSDAQGEKNSIPIIISERYDNRSIVVAYTEDRPAWNQQAPPRA